MLMLKIKIALRLFSFSSKCLNKIFVIELRYPNVAGLCHCLETKMFLKNLYFENNHNVAVTATWLCFIYKLLQTRATFASIN